MKRTIRIDKIIDVRIGLAGGLVMGLIVFGINYYHAGGLAGSFTAGLKQGVYTFLFGGFIMKLCENIAVRMNPKSLAISLGFLVPSAVSLILTYGVHSLKGTPMPLESTIPTAIFVIPSTLVWGYMKRSKKDNASGNKIAADTPPDKGSELQR